jgi:hypothetical protein
MSNNPVTAGVKELFDRQSRFMVEAAKEMPADKYGYHPTAEQWTFRALARRSTWSQIWQIITHKWQVICV